MRSHANILKTIVSLGLFGLLLGLGTFVTAQEEGTETPTEAAGDEAPAEEAPAAEAPAAYEERCGRCHNADGSPTRIGERFESPHLGAAEVQALGADGIRASIVEGRENMPAEEDVPEDEMTAIVDYTLTLTE